MYLCQQVNICLRKSTWSWSKILGIFHCFHLWKHQGYNLLPDSAFRPFTYVCCKNCMSGFSAFVLNLNKSGNILFRKMPSGKCLFSSASLSLVGEIREHQQKTFVRLSGFWQLRSGGGEGKVNLLKKGKFVTKIFFSYNVEWSSKNLWKMMSADVKANIKQQEIKYLVAYFKKKYLQNLNAISFDLGWYSNRVGIVR